MPSAQGSSACSSGKFSTCTPPVDRVHASRCPCVNSQLNAAHGSMLHAATRLVVKSHARHVPRRARVLQRCRSGANWRCARRRERLAEAGQPRRTHQSTAQTRRRPAAQRSASCGVRCARLRTRLCRGRVCQARRPVAHGGAQAATAFVLAAKVPGHHQNGRIEPPETRESRNSEEGSAQRTGGVSYERSEYGSLGPRSRLGLHSVSSRQE